MRRALAVLLALTTAAGVVAVSFHTSAHPAAASPTTTTTSSSASSPPAPLAALRPRRITLVGDSVMGEVAAAVEAATAGRADVDYVLTIGTANVNDDWWDVWPRVVARDRPDDVAVLVGPWEINRSDLGRPSWASWYGDRLDRWADQLTAGGAHLVWLTPAPARAR